MHCFVCYVSQAYQFRATRSLNLPFREKSEVQGLGPTLQLLHSVRVSSLKLTSPKNGKKHFLFLVNIAYWTVFNKVSLTEMTVLGHNCRHRPTAKREQHISLGTVTETEQATLAGNTGHVPLAIKENQWDPMTNSIYSASSVWILKYVAIPCRAAGALKRAHAHACLVTSTL